MLKSPTTSSPTLEPQRFAAPIWEDASRCPAKMCIPAIKPPPLLPILRWMSGSLYTSSHLLWFLDKAVGGVSTTQRCPEILDASEQPSGQWAVSVGSSTPPVCIVRFERVGHICFDHSRSTRGASGQEANELQGRSAAKMWRDCVTTQTWVTSSGATLMSLWRVVKSNPVTSDC